jgi:hypothetical protein
MLCQSPMEQPDTNEWDERHWLGVRRIPPMSLLSRDSGTHQHEPVLEPLALQCRPCQHLHCAEI